VREFQTALKRFLLEGLFYTIEEYFDWELLSNLHTFLYKLNYVLLLTLCIYKLILIINIIRIGVDTVVLIINFIYFIYCKIYLLLF
jgi:hypothetical protein